MQQPLNQDAALDDLLVLELGDEGTQYCGKLLADMGARVIKIEPSQGCAARHRGPFKDDVPDVNSSLYFWAYNSNKESMVLDLAKAADLEMIRLLAKKADVILEDYPPGFLASLGLGYPQLSKVNRKLVYTSITSFGQTGPLRDWKGSDLVHWAMGGLMWLSGYSDPATPPLCPQGDFSYVLAGEWACIGTMGALLTRDAIGEGQHVDVSAQEAVSFCTEWSVPAFEYQLPPVRRADYMAGQLLCKDGKYIVPLMLTISPDKWIRFLEWLKQQGEVESFNKLSDVEYFDPVYFRANFKNITEAVRKIAATKDADEMMMEGQKLGLTWAAFNAPEELFDDEQLKYRGFFRTVYHPEHGASYTYAGPPYEWSQAPWRIRRRPPLLGEDTSKLAELLPLSR